MAFESARRARAALAYSGKTREQFAAAIDTSTPTLDRMTSKTQPRQLSWEEMEAIANAADLPPEWFTVDLSRLAEIAVFPPPLALGRQAPPGELGQSAEGSRPNVERRQRKATREEGDESAAAE